MILSSATRRLILGAGVVSAVGAGVAMADERKRKAGDRELEVGPVEDLMREHGVLRRALQVYQRCALLLRGGAHIPPGALRSAATLFRDFGEAYHEKELEEGHIFPALRRASGRTAALADLLAQQHGRGREITAYIINATETGRIDPPVMARTLEGFVLMYQNHADREDTVLFPAWKASLSEAQLHAVGEEFEAIEHRRFGRNGFQLAVQEIAEVEASLGLADLALFTAPPPPRA